MLLPLIKREKMPAARLCCACDATKARAPAVLAAVVLSASGRVHAPRAANILGCCWLVGWLVGWLVCERKEHVMTFF